MAAQQPCLYPRGTYLFRRHAARHEFISKLLTGKYPGPKLFYISSRHYSIDIFNAEMICGFRTISPFPKPSKSAKQKIWGMCNFNVTIAVKLLTGPPSLLPVFVFDPRFYGKTWFFSLPRVSPMRAKFQIESVSDLRQSLRRLGSDLVVRVGRPEAVIESLSSQGLEIDSVYLHRDVAYEEVKVEAGIKKICADKKIDFKTFWGGLTLHHLDDLPFPIHGKGSDVLNVFTMFRKSVENSDTQPRAPLVAPTQVPRLPSGVSCGEMPSVEDLMALGDNLEFAYPVQFSDHAAR
jgi:hypothetical protein